MAKFPIVRSGQRTRHWSARELNNVYRAAEAMDGLTVSPPLQLLSRPGGTHIGFDTTWSPDMQPGGTPPLTTTLSVVLVEEPTAETDSLVVRPVQYRDPVPQEGQYAWAGLPFRAYPAIGHRAFDYADAFWRFSVPRLDTTVMTARRVGSFWFVEFSESFIKNTSAPTGIWCIADMDTSDYDMLYELDPETMTPRSPRQMTSPAITPTGVGGDKTIVYACGETKKKIYILNADNLTLIRTIRPPGGGPIPEGIGGNVDVCWYAGRGGGETGIWRLDLNPAHENPAPNVSFQSPVPTNKCGGIGGDAEILYYLDQNAQIIYSLDPENGREIRRWDAPRGGTPTGVGGDAETIYYCNVNPSAMMRLDPHANGGSREIHVVKENTFDAFFPVGIGGVTPA